MWQDPLIPLRFPKLFDLRADPFERAQADAGDYERWRVEHAFVLVPAQAFVAAHLKTYVEFPPRQKPGSFSLDQVLNEAARERRQAVKFLLLLATGIRTCGSAPPTRCRPGTTVRPRARSSNSSKR